MSGINKRLSDILFLDIETAGVVSTYSELSDEFQALWSHKARVLSRDPHLDEEGIAALFESKAGIYSEFAKVVCVSVGFFVTHKQEIKGFRTKTFVDNDEQLLLDGFISLLQSHFDKPKKQAICGHNIKEFDIPFLCRRMIIHGLKVPKMMDIAGKKPWEVDHLLDTLIMWRFGDYKNYTSLRLMAAVLGIPSPKEDIDGSMVHLTYWQRQELSRIVTYCERDVYTTALVYLKLNQIDRPDDLDFISTTKEISI